MSRRRFVLLAIAALLAISLALLFATRRNASHDLQGAPLLPTLGADLNAVTRVSIGRGGTPTTTLEKSAAGWTVKERDGYPADVGKLRKLLTALGEARIVEEKTADPARYPLIGVEDPGQPGATGTSITLVTGGRTQGLIVGKSAGAGSFVRRAGEQQSYSVEPGIAVEGEPHFWIDARLLDVPAAKILRVEFKPPAAAAYAVHRAAADAPFSLDGAPAGRQPQPPDALAPAPTTFTGLTAEDVAPLGGIDFSQPFVTVLTLTDGGIITLTGAVAGVKHWVQVSSTQDAALTARAQGRAFEVPGYRYDALFKPLEQLLIPKPTPAAPSRHP